MRGPVAIAAIVLLLAGCSAPTTDPSSTGAATGVQTALVTPGTWDVRADTDHVMAWVRNLGSAPVDVALRVTGPDGGPLPEGWNVTLAPATLHLAPDGTARTTTGAFPAWGVTVATLRLPADAPAGNHGIELHANDAVHPATVVVHAARAVVANVGNTVTVDTVGTFQDTGEEFWSGEFSTKIGPGARAVTGVGWGLVGTAVGETVPLVVPPALAYGYDNKPGSGYEQFNGRTLVFTMTAKRIA